MPTGQLLCGLVVGILANNVGHGDLVFRVQSLFISSSVHSLCAVVTICGTLVDNLLILHFDPQDLEKDIKPEVTLVTCCVADPMDIW